MALSEDEVNLILAAMKFVTVILGFYIVYLAIRAYQKQPSPPLLWLGIGMAVLTLGAISEGAAYQGLNWSIDSSHLVEGVVTLLGFAILVYSLHRN